MSDIVYSQDPWYILLAPVGALIFFLSSLAEAGRTPFDLVEAESEIVAGYNIEYSGMMFGMFMVAEFFHSFTVAALAATLFLGGWRGPLADTYPLLGLVYFLIKTGALYFVVMWIRYSFPRIRIDQMLGLNWKLLTPLALGAVSVAAVADKLAASQGWARTPTHLAANVLLFLVTVLIIRAYARALRRNVVGMEGPEAAKAAGAALGFD